MQQLLLFLAQLPQILSNHLYSWSDSHWNDYSESIEKICVYEI